jgi:hypothetical protein
VVGAADNGIALKPAYTPSEDIAMRTASWIRSALPSAAVAAVVYVLGFSGAGSAQPPKSHEPYANTVAQQAEMIQLLKEINLQLKDQNQLLRDGTLNVTLVAPPKR